MPNSPTSNEEDTLSEESKLLSSVRIMPDIPLNCQKFVQIEGLNICELKGGKVDINWDRKECREESCPYHELWK